MNFWPRQLEILQTLGKRVVGSAHSQYTMIWNEGTWMYPTQKERKHDCLWQKWSEQSQGENLTMSSKTFLTRRSPLLSKTTPRIIVTVDFWAWAIDSSGLLWDVAVREHSQKPEIASRWHFPIVSQADILSRWRLFRAIYCFFLQRSALYFIPYLLKKSP